MAKKSRRKIFSQSPKKTSADLSTLLKTVKKNILHCANRDKFLNELANSETKKHLPSFQSLLNLNPEEITLDDSISHIGGCTEIAENRYWVSDEFNHRIVEVNDEWQVTKTFGEFGADDSGFHYPRSILKLKNNEIAIVDAWNHRVKFYDTDGNFLDSIGQYGTGDACFFEPVGIAEDARGLLYILDRCNHRVVVYCRKKVIFSLGTRGTKDECSQERFLAVNPSLDLKLSLEFPSAILYRNEKLYISDSGNHRVLIYDLNGTFCSVIEGFSTPQKMVFSGETLAVADMNNQRVVHLKGNGATVFSYTFSSLSSSSSKESFYPESIFSYKDSLLFGFSNSQKFVRLPLSENYVSSFLEKDRELMPSDQFILNETSKALEAGEYEKVLPYIERLLQEEGNDFNSRDIELLLPFFSAVSKETHLHEKVFSVLERVINIGKKRLQEVLSDVEMEYKTLFNLRMAYAEAEAEENFQSIILSEEQKGCSDNFYTQKERFEKQKVVFYAITSKLYDTTSLMQQLSNSLLLYDTKDNPVVLNHLLELCKMFLDPLTRHFQKKGTYFSSANEAHVKNDFNDNQNWVKFIKSYAAMKEEKSIVALLFDNVSFLLPTLTKNIKMMGSNFAEAPLLMEITSKLLEFDLCLRLEPLANRYKNDYFIKGIEIYLAAFSQKFPGEVTLGANPEIVSFFAFLTNETKEMPMTINPLTNLQIFLLAKRGVGEEELKGLVKSGLSKDALNETLGSIVSSLQEIEKKLTVSIEEFNKQGAVWGEKHYLLQLTAGDQRKTLFLMREVKILEFALERAENGVNQCLYEHLVLVAYLLLGNDAIFRSCLEKNDSEGAVQVIENIFQMKNNFGNQVELIDNEIKLLREASLELVERKTSGIKQEGNERSEDAKRLFQLQIGEKIPPILSEHFSLVKKIALNFFDLFIEDFNVCREKLHQQENEKEFFAQIEMHNDLKNILLSSMNSGRKKVANTKDTLDFAVEVELAGQGDCYFIKKTSENFLVFSTKHGQLRRYTKDWIDLGVALKVENAGLPVRAVGFDSYNHLYVSVGNGLLVYNTSFELIKSYLFHGIVKSQDILGVSVIQEKIFLCDTKNDRILSINPQEEENSPPTIVCDSFKKPASLLPLEDGKMLIIHRSERFLQLVDESWNVLHFFDNSKKELSSTRFRSATQDSQGRFWVTSPCEGGLYVFDDKLNYLFRYGQKGRGYQEFLAPRDICYVDNIIYVTDHLLNRIVSIQPPM